MKSNAKAKTWSFLQKGGEMGELTRNFDWENSIIGTPDSWPQSLRTTISIILNSKFPMFLWWGEKLLQFYNDAYRPSLGNNGKHPEALGRYGEDSWPEIWPDIKPMIDHVFETGEPLWRENAFLPIYRNGRLEDVYWTFCYSPVYDESGMVAGVLVTCTETTKEVLARQKIIRSEQNLRNTILQAPVAMCIMRGNNFVVEIANERMYEIWGITEKQILGHPIFEILPEARGQGFEAILNRVFVTGETQKRNGIPLSLARNGALETIFVDFTYEAFREESGAITGIIAVVLEVTDHHKYLNKIIEAEERARMAIESAGLGFYEANLKTGEFISEKRMNEIFGTDKPLTHAEYVNYIHPDDLPIRTIAYHQATVSGRLEYEARIIHKDQSLHWIKVSGKLIMDNNNIPVKIRGIMQDITALKEIEYQKDDFIGVVSHELKTPLTTLKGYSTLLTERFKNSDDQQTAGMLNKIQRQVDRLNYIIKDLFDVTRIEANKIMFRQDHFDFSEEVQKIVEEIQTTTQTHRIIYEKPGEIFITADLERTSQVLTNLLSNSIRYSPYGSDVQVGVWKNDNDIFCSVKDFGNGIAKKDQHKIFERYFQISDTSRSNSGFGLGLYISAQIINRQNGQIWVESEPGKGSTFFIRLPVTRMKNADKE